MRLARISLSIIVMLAAAVFVGFVTLSDRNEQVMPETQQTAKLTNAACKQCHAEVWSEWETSYHSQAWVDANVQASFEHFGHDRKCESCHAPQPVFAVGLNNEVILRPANLESGVNCMSCHATADGKVAAVRSIADAPCQPVETPALSSSEQCAGCHVALYNDWKQTVYHDQGKTCQSCHMPKPDSRTTGHSHLCLGGHEPELVRSGVRMTCEQREGKLVVSVTNHATGHNFPGERHHRVLMLRVIQQKPDGTITSSRQETIKAITPFRGESSTEQIRAGETFTAEFAVVEPPVVAEVQLLYKLFPWHPDQDALVVHQQDIPLMPK